VLIIYGYILGSDNSSLTTAIFITSLSYILFAIKRSQTKNRELLKILKEKKLNEPKDSGAYLKFNKKFEITYISSELKDLIGDCQGDILELFENCTNNKKTIISLKNAIKNDSSFSGMIEFKNAKNSLYLDLFVYKLGHTSVKGVEYIMICNDITSYIVTEEELKNSLLKDKLTKLPTRLKLLDDINSLKSKKHSAPNTLISIQIDNYEEINEFFGLETGYGLLKEVSLWLKKNLPTKNATLYKFEHNNFVIFTSARISLIDLERYLKELTAKINSHSFNIDGIEHDISFTIGVSRGKKDLLKYAYIALKEAQKSNKPYKIFNKKSHSEERFLNNIKTNKDIREALNDDRVIPFFQPILNLKTEQIEKFESLMRIQNIDNTYQKPGEFLEVAKKGRLYPELTKKMIVNSIKRLEILKHPITINLSIEDITNPKISNFIIRSLQKIEFANLITFEIVETDKVKNYKKVANFIKKIKNLNCKVAIDDFGSGYSNFEQILKLDIDYIKIDGSLIKNIDSNKENEIVTKTIIAFAKELGIKTIAEFVYNESIYNKVKMLGIDYAQGYYIGKPAPIKVQ
jgi:diguanylate cyclase (GGDEF)-like protein